MDTLRVAWSWHGCDSGKLGGSTPGRHLVPQGSAQTEGGVHQVLGDGGAHRVSGWDDHLEAME